MLLTVATNTQAWAISGNATVFTSLPTPTQILDSLLNVQQDTGSIASEWPSSRSLRKVAMASAISSSLTGGLAVTTTGITGGTNILHSPWRKPNRG